MKTCPACAAENSETSRHCSACGSPLDQILAATVAVDPQAKPRSKASVSDSDSSIHGRFLPGTKIADRYRIVSLAGRGGMGEVYRADDLKLGHPVALKFLPRDVAQDSRSFQFFLNEVRLSRQIAHPNVCRVYDIDEVDGQQFLSMEYIDGEDLKGLLRRIGRLPGDKGVQIAQQICAGLVAAHEKGVLHRDLKPANIMIDGRGQVRITDFGLARLVDGTTGAGEISGTPAYMAPEQLARGETTIQTDLYSLGLILHEIFTGQPVHKGSTLPEILRSVEDSAPSSPSALVADLDPAVERAIQRCLEKDPVQRPKSARAVAAALPGGDPLAAALAAGETPSPEMVAAAGERGAIDKRWGIAALAGVAFGLGVVCWLADSTYLVNQAGLERHPASLADEARRIDRSLGYTNKAVIQAYGFLTEARTNLYFWYRQSPVKRIAVEFYNGWGKLSFARINQANPPWNTPGESGVELDPSGKLIRFRAVPPWESLPSTALSEPAWHEWFPEETAGIDLKALEPIEDRGVPPPDAYDQLQTWRSGSATNVDFYVQAAAVGGRPVYFAVLSPDEFEGRSPSQAMWPRWQPSYQSAEYQLGETLIFAVVFLVWIGAGVLTWHNFRLGRSDRRGAIRVAFFLFAAGMLSWLFLASHIADGYELPVLQIGMAHALWGAAIFWLYYSALEPYARRVWPQLMISWSRLLAGRWRDSLVGQNLLLGVLAGVVLVIARQAGVLAPAWFGMASPPAITPDPLTLASPSASVGYLLNLMIGASGGPLFSLIFLLILRFALRRTLLVSFAYVAVLTSILTLFSEATPVIGWLAIGFAVSLSLWVYLRLGFLAGIVMALTRDVLTVFPLTTNISAWYAGSGYAAIAFILALACFGFYTSQGVRPIFQAERMERTAN